MGKSSPRKTRDGMEIEKATPSSPPNSRSGMDQTLKNTLLGRSDASETEHGHKSPAETSEAYPSRSPETVSWDDQQMQQATDDPWIGREIGKYQVLGLLGRGGMGAVYAARDPIIDRIVAVKALSPDASRSPELLKRLLLEAKTAGNLNHPHVVTVYDLLEQAGTYFIVMEHMDGTSVIDRLDHHSIDAFHWGEATRIISDCCRALVVAHQQGVIHRDIKPHNIMLTSSGVAKLSDFGLTKVEGLDNDNLTQHGQIVGTPSYMSPEQWRSQPLDPRTDLYSLGATYYHLLTGQPPYPPSRDLLQMMMAHCQQPVPDPHILDPAIPDSCCEIIRRAMAKDRDERYQTAEEFLADLERALAGETSSIRQPALPEPNLPGRRRQIVLAAAAAITLVGMIWMATGPWEPREGESSDASPPVAGPAVRGITPTRITFGMSAPFSGPSKELGREMAAGINACFEEVNAAGGVHGRTLQLVQLDDGYEPDRALENMRDLIQTREVFAVIGNVGTPTAEFTVPYANEQKCLFFAPFTGALLLRRDPPDRYVFNYRASYTDEAAALVRYFVEQRGIRPSRIAVFGQDDSYGDAGFQGVVRALRPYAIKGEEILRTNYRRNTVAVGSSVEFIQQNQDRIEAVVMVPTYKAAARFVRDLRDRKIDVPVGAISFVGSDALAEEFLELGGHYGAGVVVTQVVPHYRSHASGVIRYQQAMTKHFPQIPLGFVSLEGYIAACLLIEALENAGENLDTETLIDTLESSQGLDLGIGPTICFGPSNHQGSYKVWGTVLDDAGTFRELELE